MYACRCPGSGFVPLHREALMRNDETTCFVCLDGWEVVLHHQNHEHASNISDCNTLSFRTFGQLIFYIVPSCNPASCAASRQPSLPNASFPQPESDRYARHGTPPVSQTCSTESLTGQTHSVWRIPHDLPRFVPFTPRSACMGPHANRSKTCRLATHEGDRAVAQSHLLFPQVPANRPTACVETQFM
eukprot:COSAG02_NODE_434_length_22429_cov_15.013704_10_plen_187_part_00